MTVDINCDMGEGMANDAALMPYITSANIACGWHAGSEKIMARTVELCVKHNVLIGAHPGFADRENFGRTEMNLSDDEYYQLITDQLTGLKQVTDLYKATIHHVKPHGALYNMAAKDKSLAAIIAKAVKDFDESLTIYGLSGSHSITEAQALQLKTNSEVFADRTYRDDGSLTSRTQPNAMIHDEAASLKQVLQMVEQQTVTTFTNNTIPIVAQTICVHGDGEHAVEFAKLIHQALKERRLI